MKTWKIELVTGDILANIVSIDAENIVKTDHYSLFVDGIHWALPKIPGMSFGEISIDADE